MHDVGLCMVQHQRPYGQNNQWCPPQTLESTGQHRGPWLLLSLGGGGGGEEASERQPYIHSQIKSIMEQISNVAQTSSYQ